MFVAVAQVLELELYWEMLLPVHCHCMWECLGGLQPRSPLSLLTRLAGLPALASVASACRCCVEDHKRWSTERGTLDIVHEQNAKEAPCTLFYTFGL